MSSATPPTQLAVIIQKNKSFAADIVPVLRPGDGEILIKVHAVAQNPSEWRGVEYGLTVAGRGTGNDLAGEVIALGPGVDGVSIGDRVATFVRGGWTDRLGAFREYALAQASPILHIPDNATYEEACTVPLTACTAALGMARLFDFPQPAPLGRTILIWGESSSLGLYAIQLARLSNLRVIATASPKNFDLVRSHGAAVVLDYRDPEVIAKIVTATQSGGVDYVLDTISEDGTVRLSSKALRANGPKKSVVVLPVPSEELDPSVECHFVFMATLLGKEVQLLNTYFPIYMRDYKLGTDFCALVEEWLKDGRFKVNPVVVRPGVLYGIPEGIQFMRDGKACELYTSNVSGTKLVYRVAETSAAASMEV
ncbi:quinone oxidoreductase 17 [Heterobasidion irregulare TC 32-1]|uniref:Quinone oxidoreductase 17 n=1 Tax=Heterobasidion irregulare (strain TC 32-1) TaxID=747525 RepID=W4KI77_HETIT|nr:quinone oxidoreductase 17 [Heterobasidion irregulare TC 32-1]ETW85020.1 quinone oxidoreductase 17 [Heterobasidion irregulare TC 32-1]